MARAGRRAVKEALPKLREKYSPDLVIANVENLAHGTGISLDPIKEMMDAGIQVMTSGNHVFKNKEGINLLDDKNIPIIRPANYPEKVPGRGFIFVEVGSRRVMVINVLGQVFFDEGLDSPFEKIEKILEQTKSEKKDSIIIDAHTEATSEAKALGYFLDGKVSAVFGTHSHIPTADEQILPKGTAYITDAGMCGAKNSVLGVSIESSLSHFLTKMPSTFERPEATSLVQGVALEIDDETMKPKKIERFEETVTM